MRFCNIFDKKSNTYEWFTATDRTEAERFISTKMILQPHSNIVLYPADFELHIFNNDIITESDLSNSFNDCDVIPMSYIKAEYFDVFMSQYEESEDDEI